MQTLRRNTSHKPQLSLSMVLTVHHLALSQSERIVWLCEELSLTYDLKIYQRSPLFAPPELKTLHPLETAPIITDGDITLAESGAITLAESGAIVEYILAKYAHGELQIAPSEKAYPDYLYWLHFANGTLQPSVSRSMYFRLLKLPSDNPVEKAVIAKREHALKLLDERLRENEWLAGKEFTAADIMNVVSLTTLRLFIPYSLESYPNIVTYLQRVGNREGYKSAMRKGDPGFEPVLGVEAPKALM